MKKSNRRKGIILSYIQFVLNVILSIVISAFIVRTVGKSNYGVYQSMTAFISYLVLLEFGTSALMARNISLLKKDGSDDGEIKKHVSTIWSLTIILACLILIFAFIFYFLIGYVYNKSFTGEQIELGKKIFIFAGINLLFTFLTSTLNGLILAYEHYTFDVILTLSKLILRSALIVVFLSIRPSVIFIAILDCSLSVIVFLITMFFCVFKLKSKLTFKYFDKSVLKQCLPLAFAMLLQSIVNAANGIVDKFLISIMMTPEDVAVYSISMTIFNMYSSVATLPITMFMPSIAAEIKKGISKQELTQKLVPACRLNVIVSGIICLGFFTVGKQFISLVYGEEFVEAWIYAMMIIIPMFFNMTNAVIVNVLDVYNKRHIRSLILMITTALNIGITIVGIKMFGMIGAAAGTVISLVLQTIVLNIYYHKGIKIKIPYLFKESYKGIISSLLVALAFAYPIQHKIANQLLSLLIGGIALVAIFACLFITYGATDYEKERVKSFISSFSKKLKK